MQTQERPFSGPYSPRGPFPLPTHVSDRHKALLIKRERLEVGLERLHSLFLDMVKRRIDILDELTADADLEPTLGAPEHPDRLRGVPNRFFVWSQGGADDREDEETDCDLGGVGDGQSQLFWGRGAGSEGDGECDDEATLGAALDLCGAHDQRRTWNPIHARRQMVDGVECDDAEHDGAEPDHDGEHSLGTSETNGGSQIGCGLTTDEREGDLGSLEAMDQTAWGQHSTGWAIRDGEDDPEELNFIPIQVGDPPLSYLRVAK